ncbi:FxSxx-COOH cyclophane-containing RiPP peptide [Streptomyces sp. NPDC001020]
MGTRDESPSGASDEGVRRTDSWEPVPDLLELDLGELRTIEHPVLREVLAELRERASQPSEMLWGFNNAF